MREVLAVWRSPKQTVLVALIAAAYAAVLIPFKIFTIIPGYTEVRPANAIPVAMAILFGPAAAWGSAIGNLIGDLFGTLTFGSLFGFVGNFLYGLIPWQVWRFLAGGRKASWKARPYSWALLVLASGAGVAVLALGAHLATQWQLTLVIGLCALVIAFTAVNWEGYGRFWIAVVLASIACGALIGWGLETSGMGIPFVALGNVIVINNAVMSLLLAPLLLQLLTRPMTEVGLIYEGPPREPGAGTRLKRWIGFAALVVGCVGVMVACNAVGLRLGWEKYTHVFRVIALPEVKVGSTAAMGWAGGPFLLLILIGCALL